MILSIETLDSHWSLDHISRVYMMTGGAIERQNTSGSKTAHLYLVSYDLLCSRCPSQVLARHVCDLLWRPVYTLYPRQKLSILYMHYYLIMLISSIFVIRICIFHTIYKPDRETDRYFIDRNKSHYRLICHSNKRYICTCIYKNVSLLKSYMTIYMV